VTRGGTDRWQIVSFARSTLVYVFASAMGVVTLAAIAGEWLPAGVVAVAFAAFFILVLPEHPRIVVAYCAGAALAIIFTWVIWTVGVS
jgi:hypothetical protein